MKNNRLIALRGDRLQSEVASEIGISRSTYSMIELGKRFPRRDLMLKICNYFNVTPDYLFYENCSLTTEKGD